MAKVQTPKTRMAPRLAPKPLPAIPRVYDPVTTKAIAKIAKKKTVTIVARSPVDDQFHAELAFAPAFGSDAGKSYSEPLVNPDQNAEYYARVRIIQNRVDPLLQGFETRWELPAGWTFVDGQGSTVSDEAISNPTVIVRVVKSPASPVVAGFRVVVTKKYLP